MAEVLPRFLPVLLAGLAVAVEVALGAFALALVAGLALALLTRSPTRLLREPAWAYIEFVRGTPALTQLFILYFGLSEIGLSLSPMTAAITGLGANGAAYLANIYRAGIDAVDRGQREAALSLGLTPTAVLDRGGPAPGGQDHDSALLQSRHPAAEGHLPGVRGCRAGASI